MFEIFKAAHLSVACTYNHPKGIKGSQCVTHIIAECSPFGRLHGGDSDTLAAITGGIAEAYYGIPKDIENQALTYLPEEFQQVI